MLASYRSILRDPGTLRFSAAGALARAEIAMVGLGTVLTVHASTGSYAQGGAVSATIGVTSALVSPASARIADRFGQAALLRAVAGLHAAALVGLAAAAVLGAPLPVLLAIALPAGATSISVGSLVRARWAALLTGTDRLQTAFALEAVIDELVFIVGPIAVTLLAAARVPALGLLLAAALTVAGDLLLARQRATEPVVAARDGTATVREAAVLRTRGMLALIVVFLLVGGVFGSAEVSAAARANALGVPAAAGVVLACWSAGSLVAGLAYGTLRLRSRLPARFAVLAIALAVVTAPMALMPPIAVLAFVFLAAGLGIAPVLTAGMSLVEQILPASRLTEGFAWVNTAISLTYALGAAAAGAVIDRAGPGAGFLLPVGCAIAAALVAVAAQRRFRPTAPKP